MKIKRENASTGARELLARMDEEITGLGVAEGEAFTGHCDRIRHLRAYMIARYGLRDTSGWTALIWPLETVGSIVRKRALPQVDAAHESGVISAHERLEAYEAVEAVQRKRRSQ